MSYFQKLADYLPQLKSLNFQDYTLKIISDVAIEKCFVNSDDLLIIINIDKLSYKEKDTFSKLLKESFDEDEVYFVEETKDDLIISLYSYDNKDDKKLLEYFKNILSHSDWSALRDSLFLKDQFLRHGQNIGVLKNDIKNRYGERGNIISNLCTAGYFEQIMLPLCKKSISEFWYYYGIAIDKGIVAEFVNKTMSLDTIEKEITHKLNSAKRYGLKCIHIHGIGKKNINKIKSFLENFTTEIVFKKKEIYYDDRLQIFVVELELN